MAGSQKVYGGDPAVNLFLAILGKAKEDGTQMWIDFQGTELCEQGLLGIPDSLGVAWWVCEYRKEVKDD